MDEYDDPYTYSCDTAHDMRVGFDNFENTCTPDVFDKENIDDYINDLKDWD